MSCKGYIQVVIRKDSPKLIYFSNVKSSTEGGQVKRYNAVDEPGIGANNRDWGQGVRTHVIGRGM